MFKNPWIRIWLLASFLWLVGFNVWSYQRWEKMSAVSIMLLEQEVEAGRMTEKEIYWTNRKYTKYYNYWWWLSPSGYYPFASSSWLGQNIWWYCIWSFGPVVVGLITVIGTKWIFRGFKESAG